MPRIECSHVEVYIFRRKARRVEFLALRRAAGRKLPGVWQPITGRLEPRERTFAAAVRETREETGFHPVRWWALETMTTFFEHAEDTIRLLPLFAAEVPPAARVRLSREHDAFEFVSAREAARRFLWDAQRRGLEAVKAEVLAGGPLANALEIASEGSPRMRGRRRARP